MDIKIAGCVILYNPDNTVVNNIKTYIEDLDMLYIIDNSNGSNVVERLLQEYQNINYIKNEINLGIAKPLNKVLELIKSKYNFLLTMDQDSYFVNKSAANYREKILSYDWSKTLGISPVILDKKNKKVSDKNFYAVITSGNLVNVKNVISIGGYNEDLFIDEVDNEFCYRGVVKGYKSCKINDGIYMKHCIGEPISVKIFNRYYHPMNHNYIRTYYIIRNRLYVYFKYHNIDNKNFYYNYIRATFRLVFGKIFFEKDKKRKLKSIYLGIRDYILKNMGKKEFNY